MLTELSVVEQRYLAVREGLDGVKITDVATRYGVDRRGQRSHQRAGRSFEGSSCDHRGFTAGEQPSSHGGDHR